MTRLSREGIHATVHRFSRYRSIAGGGFTLKVPPHQMAKAEAILACLSAGEINMDEYVSSDDESYTRCPKCRSVNVSKAPLPANKRWLAVLGLGIPLFFIPRDYACRKCRHTWTK